MSKKDLLNKIRESPMLNFDNMEDLSSSINNPQNQSKTPSDLVFINGNSKVTLPKLPSVKWETPLKGKINLNISKSESKQEI